MAGRLKGGVMAKYALTMIETTVLRDDGWQIPADPGNGDWQEYQRWLAEGNVPDPYVPSSEQPPAATAVMFEHENRIRALEGLPPLTAEDFARKAGG